jgi:hypothetical protein
LWLREHGVGREDRQQATGNRQQIPLGRAKICAAVPNDDEGIAM